jgi:F-type H+-transporting ATPase subunit epsilon
MHLKLVTLLGVKVDQEIYQITLPTTEGEISVFPGHEPIVVLAVPGMITVRHKKGDSDDKSDHYAITGGIIEISQKQVKVLVDFADHGDEIVESEARAALERAIELRNNAAGEVELDKAYRLVDRHSVRLKLAELRRHHHSH